MEQPSCYIRGIAMPAELRQVDHKAVIAWERFMRESEHATPSTIRRRLAGPFQIRGHYGSKTLRMP
jgi:hypothetical protein